jgi:hypothetical protein
MKDCCEGVEFTDPVAQVHVEDDCTVVVELDGVGAQGPPGTAATVNVGTTSTLAPGSPATVANSGTQNAAILDFGIPEGPQGPAATIAVGTTSTLAPGSPATVGNSGTSSAAIFDFGIPEGQQGLQGLTGPPGIEVDATPPVDTDILWADTTEPGDQVIPPGGGTGDVLAKVSSNDYDSGWVTLDAVPTSRQVNTSGTGLSGGGDLTADRTITLDPSALAADTAFTGAFADIATEMPTGGTTGQVLAKASSTNYDTKWDDLRLSMIKPIAGLGYPVPYTNWLGAGGAQNTGAFSLFWFAMPYPVEVDEIGIRVGTGAAGSTVELYIYAPGNDGSPDALLASPGSVATDTSGVKTLALASPVICDKGGVYCGIRSVGGSPNLSRTVATSLWRPPSSANDQLNGFGNGYFLLSSGAAPNPWTSTAVQQQPQPVFWLKVNTVL